MILKSNELKFLLSAQAALSYSFEGCYCCHYVKICLTGS